MSFPTWCLRQAFDIRQRLVAQQQAYLRRRFAAEAQDARAATIAHYAAALSPLDRDILEGRVEA
jgi:hypothetical protein